MRTALMLCGAFSLLAACKIHQIPQGAGGGGQGGADAQGGGGGGAAGPTSQCEEQTMDCTDCYACAANGPCAVQTQACLADPSCQAIDDCLALCDSTPADCWETCRAQDPEGVDAYDAARTCIDCVECASWCATPLVCG